MSLRVDNLFAAVSVELQKLEKLFQPGARLTFIARFDDNEEADVFISADSADKVLALVERTSARERGERPSIAVGAQAGSAGAPAPSPAPAPTIEPIAEIIGYRGDEGHREWRINPLAPLWDIPEEEKYPWYVRVLVVPAKPQGGAS